MKKNIAQLVGAHMSISGGLEKAIERGESIGCTAIQIFTHSNRQWHISPLTEDQIERFKSAQKKSSIKSIVVHASYLINIGSPDDAIRSKSINALTQELTRCHELDIHFLILHPGARLTSAQKECIATIAQSLDQALEQSQGSTKILLENMAGQGSVIGRTFEELAAIRAQTHHKARIGFCIDTCHAFAAGYQFSTQETYKTFWGAIDNTIGIEHVHAMHLNDSKAALGASVDRHDHIGEGNLGIEPFRLIMNDYQLAAIPKILETPKGEHDDSLEDDRKNLEKLKNLIG